MNPKLQRGLTAAGVIVGMALVLKGFLCFFLPGCGSGFVTGIKNVHKILFGILMILTELNVNLFGMLDGVSMLRGYIGRGVIYTIIGTLVISDSTWHEIMIYALVFALGFLNIGVGMMGNRPDVVEKKVPVENA